MGCSDSQAQQPKNAAPKYDQVAGHGSVKFTGDRVTKTTSAAEVKNYQLVFSKEADATGVQQLKPYCPIFYGSEPNKEDDTKASITMENLLFGLENASFIDLKMGTSTITQNTKKKGQSEIDRRTKKD